MTHKWHRYGLFSMGVNNSIIYAYRSLYRDHIKRIKRYNYSNHLLNEQKSPASHRYSLTTAFGNSRSLTKTLGTLRSQCYSLNRIRYKFCINSSLVISTQFIPHLKLGPGHFTQSKRPRVSGWTASKILSLP